MIFNSLVAFFAGIFAAAGSWFVYAPMSIKTVSNLTSTSTEHALQSTQIDARVTFDTTNTYILEPDDGAFSDQKIVQINTKTGERTILVPSVRTLIPALQANPLRSLDLISTSTDNQKLFFKALIPDSDGGIDGLYAFDISRRVFTEIPFHAVSFLLSPNGQNIAFVTFSGPGKEWEDLADTIHIFNLDSGTDIASLALDKSQTVISWDGYDVPLMKWADDHELLYDVYEKADVDKYGDYFSSIPYTEKDLKF